MVYHGRARVEPRVLQPQDGADQRRGDIKVSKHGNTWILDVGVVCPGTQRYVDQGSGTTPGLAAEYHGTSRGSTYPPISQLLTVCKLGIVVNTASHRLATIA